MIGCLGLETWFSLGVRLWDKRQRKLQGKKKDNGARVLVDKGV